jgi:hypothetical protein
LVERACGVRREPLAVELQITPVRGERVVREAVFDPQRIDKTVNRNLAGVDRVQPLLQR